MDWLTSATETLLSNATYYFRFYASNSTEDSWADTADGGSLITGQVRVDATDPDAMESGDTGTFRIRRPAGTAGDALIVFYEIGGSASNTVDYSLSNPGAGIMIPAGSTDATFTVAPLPDSDQEPAETVVLRLLGGPYAIAPQLCATVTIADVTSSILDSRHEPDPAWMTNAMQLWLRADAGVHTTGGGNGTTWDDQSSYGRQANLASGDGPLPVPRTLNGQPVLRFADDRLDTASLSPGSDETSVLMVARVALKTSYGMFLVYGDNGAGSWNLRQDAGAGRLSFINGANNNGAISDADLEGQGSKLLEGGVTSDDTWRVWENGALKNQGLVAFTQAAGYVFRTGGRSDGFSLDGDIAELIVYNRALSSNDQARVGRYLADKYGLTTTYPPLPPLPLGTVLWIL